MTATQKQQIQDRLMRAKNELLEATRIAESAGTKFSTTIGALTGRVEHLQHTFSNAKTKD